MRTIFKIYFFLTLLLFFSSCEKEDTTIGTSMSLLSALINRGIDTDGDGRISTSEARAVTYLDISNEAVTDLGGIDSFTNLDTLICEHNLLTEVDVSENPGLLYLACGWNFDLANLDVSKNTSLKHLSCGSHILTELDVSHNTALTYLKCASIGHSKIDVTKNILLETFVCYMNQFTSLDISKNKSLKYFDCAANQLETVDISMNPALKTLRCSSNMLTSLDVSKNPKLTDIDCGSNKLTMLDVSQNKVLRELNINDMPSLYKVCVDVRPFPLFNVNVWSGGSPNVYYSTDCSK